MNLQNKKLEPAVVALIALSAIWGYNWVVMKECLRYAGAFDFVALRTSLGTAGLFAVLLWQRKPLRPTEVPWTIVLGLLLTTGCLGFVTVALVTGGVGKTAILVYTMPFFALVMARPILRETLRGVQWVAVFLAFAGLMTIMEPWNLQSTTLSALLALLSGISWAGGAVVTKIIRNRRDMDLVSLSAWQMLFGSIPLALLALTVPERPIAWSWYFAGALFYTSVIGQSLTYLLWFYVLNRLSVGMAGMGTLATPVIGILCASIQLGERPSALEGTGMVLILSALALLTGWGGRQNRGLKEAIR
ncbi:MAG: EamA family transporter [Thermodesulfobacteriota bacterium]